MVKTNLPESSTLGPDSLLIRRVPFPTNSTTLVCSMFDTISILANDK